MEIGNEKKRGIPGATRALAGQEHGDCDEHAVLQTCTTLTKHLVLLVIR